MSTTDLSSPDPHRTVLDDLIRRTRTAANGLPDENTPRRTTASVAFRTEQSARHSGRSTGYVNSVLSIRVGEVIGSCATEPGELHAGALTGIAGSSVDELLRHPVTAVRVAALDAYLTWLRPHTSHPAARTVRVPAGDSLRKSTARAEIVANLLPESATGPVAVIGVVNSLLAALTGRGFDYVPCDLKGGHTEWGEPIRTEHSEAIQEAGAVLASGMVLGNGTFDGIAAHCRDSGVPLVVFAQSGSAVFRELLGDEVTALSAEPYPFFWLTGEAGDIHTYPATTPPRADERTEAGTAPPPSRTAPSTEGGAV
ncbi:hypothetical protein SAMN04487904_103349 [Actinopolyspora lacussalsi subsp. righensis]|uniref:Heavy-metal chelation n=1 Tax=Actinopolyspora righensis TaxID=995060 RepID=A0A1I6YXF4_9ACTN|nr:hypothetical protein [Actinopolyspora righensis]SFT55136.1 hypothetical protein SAMN04487904_103349 [Actinopolyspora righensis]